MPVRKKTTSKTSSPTKKKEESGPVEIVVELPSQDELVEEAVVVSEKEEESNQTAGEVETQDKLTPDNDDDDDGSSFKKILLWIVAIVLFVSALAVLGVFIYQLGFRNGQQMEAAKKAETFVEPSDAPTPTVEEVIKSEYSIRVLNGSGIAGEAGKVQTLLEEEGYTVSSIGNASSSKEEETTISVKDGVKKSWVKSLSKFLEDSYTVGEGEELSEDATADVIITVGSPKSE